MAIHRSARYLCYALLGLCIIRLWIFPLYSSFWVDEMVTVFVVQHGSSDASLAVAPQIRESAYYFLPKISRTIFGQSEPAYRLPSLLTMGVALFFIARLAARLIDPAAGFYVAFACLALSGINNEAGDARPYATGTCAAAVASYYLVVWIENGKWRDAIIFLVSAALLWRIHLIFWPFYFVLALYAIAAIVTRRTRVSSIRIVAGFALLGLALLPVLIHIVPLVRDAKAHVIVDLPRFRDLRRSLQLNLVIFTLGAAFLTGWLLKWRPVVPQKPFENLAMILGWWLIQPLALFVYSHLTGNSVFISRYLSIGLPGAALVATLVSSYFVPRDCWYYAAAALGTAALVIMGQWTTLFPSHSHSNWRGAAAAVNELQLPADTPIICPSPFIEARPPNWSPDYHLPGFLYAHLPVYPIQAKPYLFPFQKSPEAETYATSLTKSVLQDHEYFTIYGGDRNVHTWRDWFAARPELGAYRVRSLGKFGDVEAVVFERKAPASSVLPHK